MTWGSFGEDNFLHAWAYEQMSDIWCDHLRQRHRRHFTLPAAMLATAMQLSSLPSQTSKFSRPYIVDQVRRASPKVNIASRSASSFRNRKIETQSWVRNAETIDERAHLLLGKIWTGKIARVELYISWFVQSNPISKQRIFPFKYLKLSIWVIKGYTVTIITGFNAFIRMSKSKSNP